MGSRSITLVPSKEQLLDIIDAFDAHGVTYYLEGGTLLGIYRDGDLLPWDKDTDISIFPQDIEKAKKALKQVFFKWRISLRYHRETHPYWNKGELRIMRAKGRRFFFRPGPPYLDIFIKSRYQGKVYWVADGNIMSVDESHYESFETIEWNGRQIKIPCNVEGYLASKYGDWKTPVKEWHCSNELTIVGQVGACSS